jgi:ATP-dependent 26S proteasome regulatory subunit
METTGRMVTMTTNHPDVLKPGLVHPGRIDKTLELGHAGQADDICSTLEHWKFQSEQMSSC